jgi:hypothetical protein
MQCTDTAPKYAYNTRLWFYYHLITAHVKFPSIFFIPLGRSSRVPLVNYCCEAPSICPTTFVCTFPLLRLILKRRCTSCVCSVMYRSRVARLCESRLPQRRLRPIGRLHCIVAPNSHNNIIKMLLFVVRSP